MGDVHFLFVHVFMVLVFALIVFQLLRGLWTWHQSNHQTPAYFRWQSKSGGHLIFCDF